MFREATSLFLPNLDGPVDAGYRLGPGDHLVLILTGDVELAHSLVRYASPSQLKPPSAIW